MKKGKNWSLKLTLRTLSAQWPQGHNGHHDMLSRYVCCALRALRALCVQCP